MEFAMRFCRSRCMLVDRLYNKYTLLYLCLWFEQSIIRIGFEHLKCNLQQCQYDRLFIQVYCNYFSFNERIIDVWNVSMLMLSVDWIEGILMLILYYKHICCFPTSAMMPSSTCLILIAVLYDVPNGALLD